MYKVSIVGTGYVGLCTAVCFATKGYKVITSTHNQRKSSLINKGIPPFHEPQLENLLKESLTKGHLRCTTDRNEAIINTDVTFIAVGTPSQPDGSINLNYIEMASKEIGEALAKKDSYHLIVVKSTVIPGTTENIVKPILEKYSDKRCGEDFGLCINPEFLREGSAIYDTLHPDKIVIGEYDEKSGDTLQNLYQEFYGDDIPPIIRTNLPTAEMIKYANNAFLATKISFINQIANICQLIPGTDVTTVAKAIGLDERINPKFLRAGLGFGGSCFPKDVNALIAYSKSLGYMPKLLESVMEVNKAQPYKAIELSREFLRDLKGKRIAILGLSFKPGTDDMREAVSIRVIERFLKEGANIIAYDPVAIPNAKKIFKDKIEYAKSPIQCIKNADCCILVTEWEEFKRLKPEDFIENMNTPIVIDGRRIYNPKLFSKKLKYAAIGLGKTD